MLEFKGYQARYQYVAQSDHYVAELMHSDDVVSFAAPTFEALKILLSEVVESYYEGEQSLQPSC